MEYNVNYFISKFSNTRDDKWCVNSLINEDKACALGWCGMYGRNGDINEETAALELILRQTKDADSIIKKFRYGNITAVINNGENQHYQEPHPKQRILAALSDVKNMQERVVKKKKPTTKRKYKAKIKYVSVPETVSEQAKKLIQN